jgi:hypothetical protein
VLPQRITASKACNRLIEGKYRREKAT